MKKYLLIFSILLSSFYAVLAQDGQSVDETKQQEKIQALYVAYITQQLALTPDEAQKFWPVHAQFTGEMKGIGHDLPQLKKEEAALNIKKKYQENFNRILGVNRCERFFRMDGEFKRRLLDRIKNNRNDQLRQNQRPKIRRGQ